MFAVTFLEAAMRVCLVEDNAANGLEPLSLTHPLTRCYWVRQRSRTESFGHSR